MLHLVIILKHPITQEDSQIFTRLKPYEIPKFARYLTPSTQKQNRHSLSIIGFSKTIVDI